MALIGIWLFIVVAVAVQCLRTDLHWQEAPLSFYLLGAWSQGGKGGFFGLAAGVCPRGAGFYVARQGGGRRPAPWLLFACAGIGLCVTALAHSNLPGHAPTLEGWVHGTAAQAAFLCVTVAMLLQSWWMRANARWRARLPVAFALAWVCLVAVWVAVVGRGLPRGLEQRWVIALILAWLLLAASWLMKRPGDDTL